MTVKSIKEKISKFGINPDSIDLFKIHASDDLWDKFEFQFRLCPESAVKRFGHYLKESD